MKITRSSTSLCSLAVLLAAISQTGAVVVSGSVTTGAGSFIELFPPFTESNPDNTVGNNTFQNQNLYAFNEEQNVNAIVDIFFNQGPDGLPGSIAAGTTVASHYVFFDPNASRSQVGWVDFDSKILGVVTSTGLLADSDIYANTGVIYLNPGLRGLESATDTVSIGDGGAGSVVGGRLNVRWTASTPGDYVRVFTERSPGAVPDGGSSMLLIGSSLLGLAGFKRFAAKR